jgi:hypothetical protein
MKRFQQINDLLANSSFFYMIAIGMDSNYSYVSNNYDRNFDQSNGSLLGKHFSITLHPEDIAICADVGMQCFNNPDMLIPATLRKHDGKGGFIITQWEMKAYFDKQGQPAGIYCIGYNITDYVDTKNRLDDAKSEINVKNDKLSEIGFMQSHVIRKPLANIMGLANILEGLAVDDYQRSINEMIISNAKELDTVIRDISNNTD